MTGWLFSRFRPTRLILGLAIVCLGLGLPCQCLGNRAEEDAPADQPTAMPATLEGTVVSVNEKSGEIVISAHVPPPKEAKETPQDTNWTVTIGFGYDDPSRWRRQAGLPEGGANGAIHGQDRPRRKRRKRRSKSKTRYKRSRSSRRSSHPCVYVRSQGPKKSEDEGAASTPAEPQEVVGHLGPLHEHKWPVRAGTKTLQIQLADDVKIHVDITGPLARRLISAGDKIAVHGQIIRNKPGRRVGPATSRSLWLIR